MKEKCSIRFLLMGSVAALALGGGMGYFAGTRESLGSYEKRIELLQEKNEMLLARQEFLRQEAEVKESLKVVEPEGFVLLEEDGFVAVYEADRKTRYSTTGILLDELPEELQQEIQQGKVIESEEQLYNFLESYSS
ncbi:MAG: hypothetical protein HFH40_06975 [Lachnospiraceae bacterium]|jgi:hypothetical protein|nr:hypothetical protein [Lachnospiraceae bacterium]